MVFDFQLDAIIGEKLDDIMIIKLGKHTVKETAISRDTGHQIV